MILLLMSQKSSKRKELLVLTERFSLSEAEIEIGSGIVDGDGLPFNLVTEASKIAEGIDRHAFVEGYINILHRERDICTHQHES